MTYALSWPLQTGIYNMVCQSPDCAQHLNGRIFDSTPPSQGAPVPNDVYMTFGDEDVTDWSTGTTVGAVHVITISIYAPRHGFSDAKQAASAVSDSILSGQLALTRGTVVNARFVDAKTRRDERDSLRRIDMRFRITVQDAG